MKTLDGEYKEIEKVEDIETVLFHVTHDRAQATIDLISKIFNVDCKISRCPDECMEHVVKSPSDIMFIHHEHGFEENNYNDLCAKIRGSGYEGIMVFVADKVKHAGGFLKITSAGFDNFILTSDDKERIADSIHSAIINRKRREKHAVSFDGTTECFYMLGKDGRIYDINSAAAGDTGLTPKQIVIGNLLIHEIGTLDQFDELIKPSMLSKNVGKVYNHRVDEGNLIFHINFKIANLPTVGIVAVITKTDISTTIYSNTLDILVNSIILLSERDDYTAGHSSRVLFYCIKYVEKFGHIEDKKFIRSLYYAALLHDIGKIGIRDNILLKDKKLTDDEYRNIALHSVKGHDALEHYEFLRDSLEFILHHHEKYDGTGYPEQLKGSEIPLGAFILSVADSFDAMTTDRPYRKALSFEVATTEIRTKAGSQFKQEVADSFLSFITPELIVEAHSLSARPLKIVAKELINNFSS